MRLLAAILASVALAACGSASLRSPLKQAPSFQNPLVTSPAPAPTPCEQKPVYKAPQPHIDEGPAICREGDPACDPNAPPAMDPINGPNLPGYELPPETKQLNDLNAHSCDAAPSIFCRPTTMLVLLCIAALFVVCCLIWLVYTLFTHKESS